MVSKPGIPDMSNSPASLPWALRITAMNSRWNKHDLSKMQPKCYFSFKKTSKKAISDNHKKWMQTFLSVGSRGNSATVAMRTGSRKIGMSMFQRNSSWNWVCMIKIQKSCWDYSQIVSSSNLSKESKFMRMTNIGGNTFSKCFIIC